MSAVDYSGPGRRDIDKPLLSKTTEALFGLTADLQFATRQTK